MQLIDAFKPGAPLQYSADERFCLLPARPKPSPAMHPMQACQPHFGEGRGQSCNPFAHCEESLPSPACVGP